MSALARAGLDARSSCDKIGAVDSDASGQGRNLGNKAEAEAVGKHKLGEAQPQRPWPPHLSRSPPRIAPPSVKEFGIQLDIERWNVLSGLTDWHHRPSLQEYDVVRHLLICWCREERDGVRASFMPWPHSAW